MRLLTLVPLILALLAAPAAAKGSRKIKRKLPPEFKYTDCEDDEAAAKQLEQLVKRYSTPAKCSSLIRQLRTKRPYPSRTPDRDTLDYRCPDGKTRQFTYILPSRYSRRKPAGVLFFLHGAIRQPAPGGGANEANMFAPAVRDLGLIVVGPSTYDGVEWGTPACRALIHHAFDFLKMHFNVDENRVYIAGHSDGGRGAFALLESEATFFAAAVPVIGAPGGVRRFGNLRNVPIFAINGAKDTLFEIDKVREAMKAMEATGIDLTFKEIADAGHDPRLFLTHKDEVCAFLKKHPREPYPEEVVLQWEPTEEDPQLFPADTMRWIRIDEIGPAPSNGTFEDPPGSLLRRGMPRLEARREGNRIEVTTRDVMRYTLLVSDEMFDLSKEIEIVTNGENSFTGKLEPDARVILEEARRFKDRKLVFSNRVGVVIGESDDDEGTEIEIE